MQLHGAESPELLDAIGVPVIRAFGTASGEPSKLLERSVASWIERRRPAAALLVDGPRPGSGERAAWTAAREIAARWPVLLAGGLDAAVVGPAISRVRPIGVDVSGGVETAGVKEAAKIAAFVAAARAAFAGVEEEDGSRHDPARI